MEHEKYGHIIGNVTAVDGDIVSFINLLRYYAVFLLPEQKFDISFDYFPDAIFCLITKPNFSIRCWCVKLNFVYTMDFI